ncbi:MAG: DoxX family protein [Patescibacteria group bacterium]
MTQSQRLSLFFLRIVMGWLFFYAGITKVLNPDWSAAGYLKGAKTFVSFYDWLITPNILPIVNFLNEWGLTFLGLSLILGVFVRLGSWSGVLLMLLYYIPILDFPYPNAHSYIVDEHIIYIFSLLVLASFSSGRVWGLENWCSNLPICSKFPKLRKLLG